MITILAGKKSAAYDKASEKILAPYIKTNSVVRRNANELRSLIDEAMNPSLFGEKNLFVIGDLFENDDAKELFFDSIETLSRAPHDILVKMEKILAADAKKIGNHARVETVTEKSFAKPAFDAFVLANAFASGDKKKTWVTFQEAAFHSDETEPTHGMIWWKLKDMMMKKNGAFSTQQLKSMARDLVGVYHEGRKGGLEMRERLEKFFLTMPIPKK